MNRTGAAITLTVFAFYVASILGSDALLYASLILFGLLVVAIPATLFAQRADELAMGVDGVRTPREFFPWESIASVELEDDLLIVHGHDGYRGWVKPQLPGKAHLEILEKLRQLERGELRAGPVATEVGQSYRETQVEAPEVLVRVAQNPMLEDDRRIDAFRRLDEKHREEVVMELADEAFRRQLERVD